jgi:hypothetical protein
MEWVFTKLKIFTIITEFEFVDREILKSYVEACYEYSRKNYKGLIRGIQNGFVSIPVLAAHKIDESAIQFIETELKKHFSAFDFPVLIDMENEKTIYSTKTPIWGKMYYGYFRKRVQELL